MGVGVGVNAPLAKGTTGCLEAWAEAAEACFVGGAQGGGGNNGRYGTTLVAAWSTFGRQSGGWIWSMSLVGRSGEERDWAVANAFPARGGVGGGVFLPAAVGGGAAATRCGVLDCSAVARAIGVCAG